MRDYKKHKTAYQTLAELGIYMKKPGFNRERTQELIEFFSSHATDLCKKCTELVQDDTVPGPESELNEQLMYDGKDLRQYVRDDNFKLYELMDGPVTIKLFNLEGIYAE